MIDIIIRRGAYSNTQYHIKETYKLKEYFDNLLGYNLYDLFPEIKEIWNFSWTNLYESTNSMLARQEYYPQIKKNIKRGLNYFDNFFLFFS